MKNPLDNEKDKKRIDYTEEEIAYRDFLLHRLEFAQEQRDGEHMYFDDRDYVTMYEDNVKAASSYIRPKDNEEDTRIVTGTTEDKENTLLSALLNYNLDPSIDAFDKNDNFLEQLGTTMESLVKKSRELENYEDRRALQYKELLDQGDAFIEETWEENIVHNKKLKNKDWFLLDPKDVTWSEQSEVTYRCATKLYPGTAVYLGNINEHELNEQPFLFTREVIPYSEAQMLWGNWKRFEFVPRTIQKIVTDDDTAYRDWTLLETEDDMVEVIKYQDRFFNEYMLILNGVMMLPQGFPLTEVSPSGQYSLVKGSGEPISKFFAYSKSIPSKTRVDQAVLDEMLRLMILKTKKSFMPPLANNTNRVLSRKVMFPGVISQNIDPDKIKPLGDVSGVNAAEFSMFELLKRLIDEKSVSPVFAGQQTEGSQTATEVIELKKQQLMKLGLMVYGVIKMERQLAWLRIYNILAHWTRKQDSTVDSVKGKLKDLYKKITVKGTLENGKEGMKVIEFDSAKANLMAPENIKAEEDFLSKGSAVEYRKIYLDPEKLRTINANWYVSIVPTEKETSELRRVLFMQTVQQALTLFGPQSLNIEYIKDRFAILAKEDPDKFFTPMQSMGMGATGTAGPNQQPQGMEGTVAGQVAQGVQPPPQPSLNTLANA